MMMGNLSFTVLGSSAGLPQPTRTSAGYVLDFGGRLILFDCGGGVSAAFRKAGYDSLAIDRIFISHTHPDHISDLPLFIQMMYLQGRTGGTPVAIYLPGEALDSIRDYFRALYLLPEKLPFETRFLPVPEDGVVEGDGISITPIRNTHMKRYARIIDEYGLNHKMQCFSYLIGAGEKTILYSADLGSETDLFPYLKNLDLLVVESTHINVEQLLEKTSENNVGRVILTHLTEDYDIGQALNIARKLGVDNFSIAHDGMRIEL